MTDTTAGEGVSVDALADDLCEHRLYRTQYLVLPRLAIAAMPIEWQARLEQLLRVADEAGMENPSYVVLRNEPEYIGTNLSDPDDEYSRADSYDLRSSDPWADYRRGDALELSPGYDATKAEALTKALAAQPSAGAQDEWPEAWSGPCTVGNMIANLKTLPPETPLYTAYHVFLGKDQKALLRVKRPTMSRERVDGITIKQGDTSIPYSAVIWANPQQPEATPAQPDTGDVAALREALVRELDHLIMHIVAIGPDDPKKKGTDREYEIPMARRVWREVAIDAILAALSKPNAPGREG